MKAICTTTDRELEVREVPTPLKPAAEHMLIEMDACGINAGDITFLRRATPMGIALSQYDVWGVSGAGTVTAIGEGVPADYMRKKIAIYRSLVSSEHTIASWCETAQAHMSSCVILPDHVDAIDYAGSLVNVITPYAFLKQAQQEQHQAILVTAGNSATGIAMLGVALACKVPVVSIVRSAAGRQELISLGATNVLVQTDPNFERDIAAMTEAAKATAVFDGVGGELLSRIAPHLPRQSAIYSYGYLGGAAPLSIHTNVLMAKSLTIKSFSNFGSPTVRDRSKLNAALHDISGFIAQPHFKTKRGRLFRFEEIADALKYGDRNGGKAILIPGKLAQAL